jgi:hypothetical protein
LLYFCFREGLEFLPGASLGWRDGVLLTVLALNCDPPDLCFHQPSLLAVFADKFQHMIGGPFSY